MAYTTSSGNRFTVAKEYTGLTAFSACAWIYYPSTGAGSPVAIWEGPSNTQQFLISKNASNAVICAINDGSSRVATSATGVLSTNTWHHICIVYDRAVNLTSYLNGSSVATATVGGAASLNNCAGQSFGIGARQANADPFAGTVAEVATWTRALSAGEVAALAKGLSPLKIRDPDAYIPLVRNVQDVASGYTITTTGSPTVAVHPRTYR